MRTTLSAARHEDLTSIIAPYCASNSHGFKLAVAFSGNITTWHLQQNGVYAHCTNCLPMKLNVDADEPRFEKEDRGEVLARQTRDT